MGSTHYWRKKKIRNHYYLVEVNITEKYIRPLSEAEKDIPIKSLMKLLLPEDNAL